MKEVNRKYIFKIYLFITTYPTPSPVLGEGSEFGCDVQNHWMQQTYLYGDY
jgi:hypothetical protein